MHSRVVSHCTIHYVDTDELLFNFIFLSSKTSALYFPHVGLNLEMLATIKACVGMHVDGYN